MRVLKKSIKTDYNNFYLYHTRIVNVVFGSVLGNKEIEVLASFMSISSQLENGYILDRITRKQIMKDLKIFPGGLTNHIKSIKVKGFIENVKGTKVLKIKDFLIPEKEKQLYQIYLEEEKEDDIK